MDVAEDRLRIDEIELCCGKIPTNLTFSYGKVDHFPFLIAKIRCEGQTGLGESLTQYYDFAEELSYDLIGRNPICLEKLLWPANDGPAVVQREALAMALYDLVGKLFNIPAHALLGGKRRSKVPGMPTIFADGPQQMAQKAHGFARHGYSALKVKLLGHLQKDAANLSAIRQVVGDKVMIQVDANLGYPDIQAARLAIGEFDKLGIDLFEDPCQGSLEEYRRLRSQVPVKIMVDQQARTFKSVAEVIRQEAADVINQHPSAQGSISDNVKINEFATALGTPTAIGDTGYLGIGTAAYQCLASVVDSAYPCGELGGDVTHGFPPGLVKGGFPLENGMIHITDTPGFGVELNEPVLSQYIDQRILVRKRDVGNAQRQSRDHSAIRID